MSRGGKSCRWPDLTDGFLNSRDVMGKPTPGRKWYCSRRSTPRKVSGSPRIRNMTRTLYLSNKVKATLSLAGSENIMTIIVPEIRRRFAGKKAFTSPWVESSIEPIHGTFKYLHTAQLTGESDATVETNDNQISIEFKLVDGGPGLEDTVIAIVSMVIVHLKGVTV
ncbi:hypothetical protein AG1IA_03890 [Rhizoctonia solani AG-1 IA]|uniref:Uncharacterized protein n=1 Tax=Thanatephorus cucumeris (strain AG1-IA) TaxID=983506 RepID=L8WZ14_THACA|nr:hypothetical protein AG1IA_03890 [Rhizoctonia solani AG-1 IA]